MASKQNASYDGLKTVLKGAGLASVGLVASKVFQYATRAVVARYDAAGYGLFAIALTTVTLAFLIATLGIDQAVLLYTSKANERGDRKGAKAVLRTALLIVIPSSIIAATLLYFGAPWLANNFFHQPDAAPLLAIAALAIPLTVASIVIAASFRAIGKIEYEVTTRSIVETGSRLAFITLFIYALGWGIMGAAYGLVLGSLASCIAALYFLHHTHPDGLGNASDRYPARAMLRFSVPLALAASIFLAFQWIATAAVSNNATAVEVGVLNAVMPTADIMTLFPLVLFSLFVPALTRLVDQTNKHDARKTISHVTKWSLMGQLPIALILIYYAPQILSALFGQEYAVGAASMVVITLGYLVYSLFIPALNLLQVRQRPVKILATVAAAIAINIVLSLVLTPRYGMLGAAAAYACGLAAYGIAGYVLANRDYGIPLIEGKHLRVVAASLASLVVLALVDRAITGHLLWDLALHAATLAIIYIPALHLFGCLEKEDYELIATIRKKTGI